MRLVNLGKHQRECVCNARTGKDHLHEADAKAGWDQNRCGLLEGVKRLPDSLKLKCDRLVQLLHSVG